jgi:hypothetical protein
VSPVKYELGFYIPEDDILHSHSRENLKSYITDGCFGYSVNQTIHKVNPYPDVSLAVYRWNYSTLPLF